MQNRVTSLDVTVLFSLKYSNVSCNPLAEESKPSRLEGQKRVSGRVSGRVSEGPGRPPKTSQKPSLRRLCESKIACRLRRGSLLTRVFFGGVRDSPRDFFHFFESVRGFDSSARRPPCRARTPLCLYASLPVPSNCSPQPGTLRQGFFSVPPEARPPSSSSSLGAPCNLPKATKVRQSTKYSAVTSSGLRLQSWRCPELLMVHLPGLKFQRSH